MNQFNRRVIFSRTPLMTFLETPNFVLYPISKEKLFIPKLCNLYPAVLEYQYDPTVKAISNSGIPELDELMDKMAPSQIFEDLAIMLLTTCSNHFFKNKISIQESIWGIQIVSDNPKDFKDTGLPKWCFPYFNFESIFDERFIFSFSKPAIDRTKFIDVKKYFLTDPEYDEASAKEISMPIVFLRFIMSYSLLDIDDALVVDKAMKHLYNGVEIVDTKKTTALLSFFTALETMVNLEYKNIKVDSCDCCGQPRFKVTKKFKEFLFNYVSKSSNKKFDELYSLRSKIVHTGEMMQSEILFTGIPMDDRVKESIKIKEVLSICRLAIINWVCMKSKEKFDLFLESIKE